MNKEDLIKLLQREDTIVSDLELSQITNLIEVRNQMRKQVIEEGSCNCILCNRKMIRYKRSINKGHFFFLLHLSSRYHFGEYVHYEKIKRDAAAKYNVNCTDYAMLAIFDLIELGEKDNGMVRITQYGANFIRGKATIPKQLYVLNGKVIGNSDERVNFTECQVKFKLKDIF